MKYCVVGGLGYIGSNLVHNLAINRNKVFVRDFEYFSKPEDYYIRNNGDVTYSKLGLSEAFDNLDVLILSCYSYEHLEQLSKNLSNEIKSRILRLNDLYQVILISDWRCEGKESRASEIETAVLESKRNKVIRFGEVFGSWERIRFDTILNNAILKFITTGEYVIPDDGCRWFAYTGHRRIYDHFIAALEKEEGIVNCYDGCERLMELIMRLRRILSVQNNKEYVVGFSNYESEFKDLEPTCKKPFSEEGVFEYEVKMLTDAINRHTNLLDFEDIKNYPNEFWQQVKQIEPLIKDYGRILQ